jgi:hypothetical protein
MEYTSDIVENLLRNYYSLQSHPDSTFSYYKLDIDNGLDALHKKNKVLYSTIVNVFMNGISIQDQAIKNGITSRWVSYRLNEALNMLTDIMNGELVDEG